MLLVLPMPAFVLALLDALAAEALPPALPVAALALPAMADMAARNVMASLVASAFFR